MNRCPRCKSRSYVNMYVDETKCMMCGHTDHKIPDDILKEYSDNLGLQGKGSRYIKQGVKKYYN